MSHIQERLCEPDALTREADTLKIAATPEARIVLAAMDSALLTRTRTDDPSLEQVQKFRDWTDHLAKYSQRSQQWYRTTTSRIDFESDMGGETRTTKIDYTNRPYVIGEDNELTYVSSFDVEQDVLPGFVRGMFVAAQAARMLSGHDRSAVRRVGHSRLLVGDARYHIDRVNRDLDSDEAVLKTLTGAGFQQSNRIASTSWIGKTFKLFSEELGDPNQYQPPTFDLHAISRRETVIGVIDAE